MLIGAGASSLTFLLIVFATSSSVKAPMWREPSWFNDYVVRWLITLNWLLACCRNGTITDGFRRDYGSRAINPILPSQRGNNRLKARPCSSYRIRGRIRG